MGSPMLRMWSGPPPLSSMGSPAPSTFGTPPTHVIYPMSTVIPPVSHPAIAPQWHPWDGPPVRPPWWRRWFYGG